MRLTRATYRIFFLWSCELTPRTNWLETAGFVFEAYDVSPSSPTPRTELEPTSTPRAAPGAAGGRRNAETRVGSAASGAGERLWLLERRMGKALRRAPRRFGCGSQKCEEPKMAWKMGSHGLKAAVRWWFDFDPYSFDSDSVGPFFISPRSGGTTRWNVGPQVGFLRRWFVLLRELGTIRWRFGLLERAMGTRIGMNLVRVVGSRGFSPLLWYKGIPLYMKKIVFGKPFLLYHRSGFHSPQPCYWWFPWESPGFPHSEQQRVGWEKGFLWARVGSSKMIGPHEDSWGGDPFYRHWEIGGAWTLNHSRAQIKSVWPFAVFVCFSLLLIVVSLVRYDEM